MLDPRHGLFGRQPELARLERAAARAVGGSSSFVLVTGEAGIGKTRLLRALAESAREAGLRTLAGTAIESGRAIPYLPLVAPLRAAVEDAGQRDARGPAAGSGDARVALRRLLRGEAEATDTASGAALETARLVEAVHDTLVDRPTLLTIDDVHWADESTIMVLDYLAHRAVDRPLLVVVAARDEVAGLLDALPIADGRRFARLALGRLSPADVRDLATALVGTTVPAARAAALHRRAGGNPFFVEQLLAADPLGRAGGAAAAGSGATVAPPPEALRALVARRIAGLEPDERRVLEALAVVGRSAPVEHVAAVAGLPAEFTGHAIEAAAAAGMTMTDDAGVGFRHPLFAEVVEAGLAGPVRRSLHEAAAELAERAGADAAEVAEHWWLAGDPVRARPAALAAACAASQAHAYAESRLHLDRALTVWPADEPGRTDVLLDAARSAWLAGDPAAALELALAARIAEPARVDTAIAIGIYAWDAGRRHEATDAFATAARLLPPDASPTVRGRASWGLGRAAVAAGDPGRAVEHARDAVEAGMAAGDLVLASEGSALAAMAHAFSGTVDGVGHAEQAVDLALRSRATWCTGHAFQFLTDLRALSGDRAGALDAARLGIEACARLGIARTHGSDLRGRAALLLADGGDIDAAEAILDPADPRAFSLLAHAVVAMRRGDLEAASRALDEAAEAGAIGGPGALGGWLELTRVELAWLRSDATDAMRWLEAAPAVPGLWGRDVRAWSARWRARLGGADERAVEDVERRALDDAARDHPDPAIAAAVAVEIDAALAAPPSAASWVAAADAWTAAGRPWEAAWARLAAASASFADREATAGRAQLEQVVAAAERMGSRPLRDQAMVLAKRARIRLGAPARERTAPDDPTERELEVLELLADGLTNPQIATQLFLSPKTVGIHVSRLLAKLDAHTRGEAVANARRRGVLA